LEKGRKMNLEASFRRGFSQEGGFVGKGGAGGIKELADLQEPTNKVSRSEAASDWIENRCNKVERSRALTTPGALLMFNAIEDRADEVGVIGWCPTISLTFACKVRKGKC
jgi:hypothetical protein